MIAPTTLNTHSMLAEVVGMLRNLTARSWSVGKSFDCIDIQNISGTSVVTGCVRYTASSPKLQSAPDCYTAEKVNLAKMLRGVDIVVEWLSWWQLLLSKKCWSAYKTPDLSIRHNAILSPNLSCSNQIAKICKLNQIESKIPRNQIKSPDATESWLKSNRHRDLPITVTDTYILAQDRM